MNPSYIAESIIELAVLGAVLYGVNLGVQFAFDVDILARGLHDFRSLPVPEWTWPTWLIFVVIVAVVVLEVVYRTHNAVLKRLTSGR